MADYPINVLKQNTGQRFLPLTHLGAIYDGSKSLKEILHEINISKADKILKMNNTTIYNGVFTSSIVGGNGYLLISLPQITQSSNNIFFEIFINNNSQDATIYLSSSISNSLWIKGSAFCTNSSIINKSIGLCKLENQFFIFIGDNNVNWDNSTITINFISINNTIDNLLEPYTLEILPGISDFHNKQTIIINSQFSSSNADRISGYSVDDSVTGLDPNNNALWTANKVKQEIQDIEIDAYTKLEINTLLSQKAPISHASSANTYGRGDSTNFGHVKISNETNPFLIGHIDASYGVVPSLSVMAVALEDASMAWWEARNALDYANIAQTTADNAIALANTAQNTANFIGSGSQLGRVKLSDSVTSVEDINAGIAATPHAVKLSYDKGVEGVTIANSKLPLNGGSITGDITPTTNNTLSIGVAENKFNSIYATTFYGDLNGNSATATTAYKINSERIPVNSNLNDYTIPGMYYNPANVDVSTMENVPSKEAFSLLVEKHAGIKQTFTNYNPAPMRMWIRNYYGGIWTAWHEVVTTISGIAPSSTKLATTRAINGVNFDGTSAITIYDSTKVAKAGDTLTGVLRFKLGAYTSTPLDIIPSDINGDGLLITAGGLTIIGGGESPRALYGVIGFGASDEQLVLGTDNHIWFYSGCQTIANRKGMVFSNSGNFYPVGNNACSLGMSDARWLYLYATSINVNTIWFGNNYLALDSARNGIMCDGNFVPQRDDSLTLGWSDRRWRYLYLTQAIQTSDKRMKTEIETIDENAAISLLYKVSSKKFKLKKSMYSNEVEDFKSFGFIAQEIKDEFKKILNVDKMQLLHEPEDDNEAMGIDYGQFAAILWAQNKKQQTLIDQLNTDIAKQDSRIAMLENIIKNGG